ncbi:MAG: hypothetical protein H6Q68_3046 [Firmicutes bacterium]|nr:hypothetical protein [Bacillota bacterium]
MYLHDSKQEYWYNSLSRSEEITSFTAYLYKKILVIAGKHRYNIEYNNINIFYGGNLPYGTYKGRTRITVGDFSAGK